MMINALLHVCFNFAFYFADLNDGFNLVYLNIVLPHSIVLHFLGVGFSLVHSTDNTHMLILHTFGLFALVCIWSCCTHHTMIYAMLILGVI